ncbi:MAG: preprotein translocase subunit SecD [Halodesulfurarchaeum sp.]
MSWIREYWRVSILVLLLVLSGVSLFAPGLASPASQDNATNLQYGLGLSGGARVRATVDGLTATGVSIPEDRAGDIASELTSSLPVDRADIQVRPGQNVVEVYGSVNQSTFREALQAVGLNPSTIREGVTEATRQEVVKTLRLKVDASGFAATSVQEVESQTSDQAFIVVQAAHRNLSELRGLLRSRGVVQMWAYYPGPNGTQQNTTVLTQEELMNAQIGLPKTQDNQPVVPVTLEEDAARELSNAMVEYGFTQPSAASACNYPDGGYCLLTVRDGRVVYSAGIRRSLAQSFESGDFATSPSFVITATNMSEARRLYADLQAGALPAPLAIQETYYVSPKLGSTFKRNSWVTGLAAAIAVSVVVFFRYGEVKVAAPMLLTALAEVVILLGFAAAANLALTLAHIAGFIAVIGTGVDDLIIIADEVMTEQVSSRRVFKDRFRRALWVIGAAAATTIIAMSPLAVLSLGDLRGFAIITILGVLIGVLVTRPAYGDILRRLLTDRH